MKSWRLGDHFDLVFCTLCASAALLLVVIYPGDAPWINDEPMLIHNALAANAAGMLVTRGIMGSQGVFYGPVPTWIYQIYLSLSHDMISLVALRGAAFILIIAASLFRVSRLARLTPLAIPVLLLSPYLWIYSRQIWDNTFCIPLSLLAMLAYLEFLQGKRWAICACILLCGAMLMTHLMCVPIVASLTLHAVLYSRSKLWASRWSIVAATVVVAAASGHYFASLIPTIKGTEQAKFQIVKATIFSLSGGQWFGLSGWRGILGDDWWSGAPATLRWLASVLGISHAFVIGGFALAASALWRRGDIQPGPERRAISFICVATVGLQTIYLGMRNALGETHYYNASWFAYAGLIWLAIEWLRKYPGLRYLPIAWAATLLLSVSLLSSQLHQTHGTQSVHYGPTLSNQIEVARTLKGFREQCQVDMGVPVIEMMPHRLVGLSELYEALPTDQSATALHVAVAYRSPNPRDGRVGILVLAQSSAVHDINELETKRNE